MIEQILFAEGFTYHGLCGCQGEKGKIYKHADVKYTEIRIFEKSRVIKLLVYDVKKKSLPLTDENLQKLINEIKQPVQV